MSRRHADRVGRALCAIARQVLTACAFATLLAACAPGRGREPAPPARDALVAHAVRGAELRATMYELDRLRGGRLPQELDFGRARLFEREALADTARAIARAATRIEEVTPPGALAAGEEEQFRALAAVLRLRAESLAADAAQLPDAALRSRLDDVDAACAACHALFRGAAAEALPR